MPDMSNEFLVLTETTARNSFDNMREKTVMVLPRDLFPMVARHKFTWTSPGVVLLVSMEIFEKYPCTCLKLMSELIKS